MVVGQPGLHEETLSLKERENCRMCLHSWWTCLLEPSSTRPGCPLCRGGCLDLWLAAQVECTPLPLHGVRSGTLAQAAGPYLPSAPPPSRSPSHCPIFLCSLAMRSSSWPGPSGKARKRSRSGWRGCADRSRRTWSWPSPSARLTCRPRRCRGSHCRPYVHTHAQSVPASSRACHSHHS